MIVHGRHRKHGHAAPALVAVASLLVVGGVFWAVGSLSQDTVAPQQQARTTGPDPSSAAVEKAVSNCRETRARAAELLPAAGAAIQQWRLHVDAMNQLVAGKITLDQARAFWESTRVEGRRTQAAWHRTDAAYRATAGCASWAALSPTAAAELGACSSWQDAADGTFDAARTALTRWDTHIAQMEALRAGRLSPAHAAHLWQQTWKRARAEIAAYDKAYERYATAAACPYR